MVCSTWSITFHGSFWGAPYCKLLFGRQTCQVSIVFRDRNQARILLSNERLNGLRSSTWFGLTGAPQIPCMHRIIFVWPEFEWQKSISTLNKAQSNYAIIIKSCHAIEDFVFSELYCIRVLLFRCICFTPLQFWNPEMAIHSTRFPRVSGTNSPPRSPIRLLRRN